jgi:hypothetical protein
MKKILLLMMISASLFACNNQGASDDNNKYPEKTDRDDKTKNDRDNRNGEDADRDEADRDGYDRDEDRNVNASWTKDDERRFLSDCRDESGNEVIQGKLDDFCSCMLVQAKKNYKNYAELDKSNTEVDLEVFGDCIRRFSDMGN